jgi:hypothetical protein
MFFIEIFSTTYWLGLLNRVNIATASGNLSAVINSFPQMIGKENPSKNKIFPSISTAIMGVL